MYKQKGHKHEDMSNMFKLCEHGALVSSPETGYILLVEFVFMFLFN